MTREATVLSDLPIFRQILEDTRRSERELQTWHAAAAMLDVVHYRTLKLLAVQRRTGIARSTLSVALDRLTALGYLDRRRDGAHEAWEYRIPLSRDVVAAAAETDDATAVEPRAAGGGRRPRRGMLTRGVVPP